MMKNITVFGATGMLGKPVVRELVAAGYKITAMVRSPEKAREVLPGSVNLIRGDLDSLPDIQNALENADGIYINLSVAQDSKTTDFQPEREGISNILAAAKDKNIQRIGYLSSLVQRYNGMNGFRWWAFDIKREALRNIKQSGIPYAIFYPSNFLEDLPEVY
ncbi:MAG: NAD(P)H-binding protein, partial [Calditrichaeota bacterium]|nr:NAD(P)H-binding protein [Calditrichota bacterium]